MSTVTPRARNERLSYSPSTMMGACRFFSLRSSRTRCKSSWSCSQSIGSLTERPRDDKGCAPGSHHISAAGYANCAGRGGGEFRTRHEGVPRGERQEDLGRAGGGLLRQTRFVHRATRRVREQGSTERSEFAQGPPVAG